MASQTETGPGPIDPPSPQAVEVPQATVWPMVLSLGVALVLLGVATNLFFCVVGAALFVIGLAGWIGSLLPGRGHASEAFVEPALRARPVAQAAGTVRQLRPGVPGYRFRLPEKVHPLSSGIWGGLVGGLVMPVPAFLYGLVSGHGIWFPINLLAGMLIPGLIDKPATELEQFSLAGLILGIGIHATFSIVFGLLFGVISPTLPPLPGGPVIAGGVLMPALWSLSCYGFMGIINPALEKYVNWPWFIASQFVYGLAMSLVVVNSQKVPVRPTGGR
jgi:hypothetical protein